MNDNLSAAEKTSNSTDKKLKVELEIQNFKCFENVVIELKPLMLLFGPNSSGKSTLIKSIKFFLYNLFFGGFDDYEPCVYFPDIVHFSFDDGNEKLDLISFEETVTNNDIDRSIKFIVRFLNAMIDNQKLKKVINDKRIKKLKTVEKVNFAIGIEIKQFGSKVILEKFVIEFEGGHIRRIKETETLNPIITTLSQNLFVLEDYLVNFLNAHNKDNFSSLTGKEFNEFLLEYRLNYAFPNYVREFFNILEYKFSRSLFYIPPVRHKPNITYNLSNNLFNEDDYYGIPFLMDRDPLKKEAQSKSIPLDLHEFYDLEIKPSNIEIIYSDDLDIDKDKFYDNGEPYQSSYSLKKFLRYKCFDCLSFNKYINKELEFLELAKQIRLLKNFDFNVGKIEVVDLDGKSVYNLIHASSGMLQVLPILCLLYKVYYYSYFSSRSIKIAIIEQPELHLHPKLQSKLFDTIIRALRIYNNELDLSKRFPIIMIETHSEHFLKKLQLYIAENRVFDEINLKEDSAVYFFEKNKEKGTTKIKRMEIDENGFIKTPFPDGFFDQASELAMSILEAQLKRKNS
ncbi:MAG: DUF3696 domain-containing protein [Ignavibacterium sp.]|nr:DUF3696 domain-containing protein [Ignavibacterium sp.]